METEFKETTQNDLKPPIPFPNACVNLIPKTHDSKLSELRGTVGQ